MTPEQTDKLKINEMSNEEIIEGNKLIDALEEAGGEWSDKGWLTACKYHTSWAWLMPVVELLETWPLTNTAIINNKCNIRHFDLPTIDFVYTKTSEADTKIEAVWIAVVEFIKWRNAKTP